MLISFKVRTPPVNPNMTYETWIACFVCIDVWNKHTGKGFVITSINDSKHRTNSRHYEGLAFDFRSHDIPSELKSIYLISINKTLNGSGYRVILEDEGLSNEHFHCGWNDSK